MRRFDLVLPRTVNDCLKFLAERAGETKVVAGGTDLLPQMKNGLLKPARVVDLSHVAALRTIRKGTGGSLRIGAAVTARTLELDARVRSTYPALAEGAALVGSVQIRNLACACGLRSSFACWNTSSAASNAGRVISTCGVQQPSFW